jgi:hypothetical protein
MSFESSRTAQWSFRGHVLCGGQAKWLLAGVLFVSCSVLAAQDSVPISGDRTAGQRFDAAGIPRPQSSMVAPGNGAVGGFRTNGPAVFGPPGLIQQFGTGPGVRSGGSYSRTWRSGSGNPYDFPVVNSRHFGSSTSGSFTGSGAFVPGCSGVDLNSWSSGLVIGSYATAPGFGFNPAYFGYGTGVFHPYWHQNAAWNVAPFGWTTDPWTGLTVPWDPACHPIILPSYGGFSPGVFNTWVAPALASPVFVNVTVSFRPPTPDQTSEILSDPRRLDELAPVLPPKPAAADENPGIPDVPPPPEPDAADPGPEAQGEPEAAFATDGIFLRGRHKQKPGQRN